jgi:hypothetical protein
MVEIQSGHLNQADRIVEMRIGRSGDDVHLMAFIGQRFAQMPDIHALPAAGGIATIREQTNLQRP